MYLPSYPEAKNTVKSLTDPSRKIKISRCPGPVKDTINGIIYIFVIVTSSCMQVSLSLSPFKTFSTGAPSVVINLLQSHCFKIKHDLNFDVIV
jgi:hypothetical protein